MQRRAFNTLMVAAAAAGVSIPSFASVFPDRPVRLVVPYTAGGNLDLTTRLVAQQLSLYWKQSVVVDNRPGANGNIGTAFVAHSPPDGYTLEMVSAGTMAIDPFVYTQMGFDPLKDLTGISKVVSGMMVLDVSPKLPIHSVGELIAYAKTHPGKLNFGSGGNGTISHLSLEMLNTKAGIRITHVPYRGTSLALSDLMGDHIDGMFDTLSTSLSYLKAGQIRGLAVSGTTRSVQLPGLPTVSEAGVPGYVADAWAGLVGPAGLSSAVVQSITQAIAHISSNPAFRDAVIRMGNEPAGTTAAAFAALLQSDSAKWSEIVRVSGARVD
jgi:tripartite-type tricarboxylate transporter receptor subunit TctC